MSTPLTKESAEQGSRCGNCDAPLTGRETGILSMSVGTRCPERGVLT